MEKEIKIVLTGGGTAGPVMPLIAVYQRFRERQIKADFLFIGTEEGPEKEICRSYNIPFKSIPAGKLRRYLSLKNFSDPFKIIKGYKEARHILQIARPDVIFSAGGFVAVPVIWAARGQKIPVLIHQQDIRKGLANKMTEKTAQKITVTFEKSLNDFPRSKTILTGNPIRSDILKGNKEEAIKTFNLKNDYPVLLVFGGGTGAENINKKVNKIAQELVNFCQVIHLTGAGKKGADLTAENYHSFPLLTAGMKDALASADLVVSRAGLCALSEFAALGKPAIIIPILKSHQEENAAFYEKKGAVMVIKENMLTPEFLLNSIKSLFENARKRQELRENIKELYKPGAADKIIDILLGLAYKKSA